MVRGNYHACEMFFLAFFPVRIVKCLIRTLQLTFCLSNLSLDLNGSADLLSYIYIPLYLYFFYFIRKSTVIHIETDKTEIHIIQV